MNARSRPDLADITLLYQDDALLVLNKPAGLLSVPGRQLPSTPVSVGTTCSRTPALLLIVCGTVSE